MQLSNKKALTDTEDTSHLPVEVGPIKGLVNWEMRLIFCSLLLLEFLCLGFRSRRCEPATLHTGAVFKPPLRACCRLCTDCRRKWSLQETAESPVSAGSIQPSLPFCPGVFIILLSCERHQGQSLRTPGKESPGCRVEKSFGVILHMVF